MLERARHIPGFMNERKIFLYYYLLQHHIILYSHRRDTPHTHTRRERACGYSNEMSSNHIETSSRTHTLFDLIVSYWIFISLGKNTFKMKFNRRVYISRYIQFYSYLKKKYAGGISRVNTKKGSIGDVQQVYVFSTL